MGYKIKRFISPIKYPKSLYLQIIRILFHRNSEVRIVELAKLKSEMGLNWTNKERETMEIVLNRTIVDFE